MEVSSIEAFVSLKEIVAFFFSFMSKYKFVPFCVSFHKKEELVLLDDHKTC
jgi:hypothetical protein